MRKPIIATSLRGLFIKSEPWEKAHIQWFRDMAKKLKDDFLLSWVSSPEYFQGVDIIMNKLYPEYSAEERTRKARNIYFDYVCKYMRDHPDVRNDSVISYFESLKQKYWLSCISTNKIDSIDNILRMTKLTSLFDMVEASMPHEKDDKDIVFTRFIIKRGTPALYIGGDRKSSYDFCLKHSIKCIYANLENNPEIPGVTTVTSLYGLKEMVRSLLS